MIQETAFQSNEFNPSASLRLRSGELAFGGINGFNIFRPEDIKDNLIIPKIEITDFQIFNKHIKASVNNRILSKQLVKRKK